ncbi:hypothetical protein D3C71_1549040 [compost metagenome]
MTSTLTPSLIAIQKAIKGAGGPAKVARECGVSVQAACFWRDGDRTLPAEHAITLEKLNNGRVRCEQMFPGVDWEYLRESSKAQATSPVTEVSHA